MADCKANPLDMLSITAQKQIADDEPTPESYRRMLTLEERVMDYTLVVGLCRELMSDVDDPELKAKAADLLQKLGLPPERAP